jgi:glycosyltransferase involved in cell wall biosynthesis
VKIVLLTRSLNYGGAERQLVTLAKGLHRRGHSVLVVPFYAGGPLESDLQSAGVRVCSLSKRRRWEIAGFLVRLIRLARREKPDVIHSYLPVPNMSAVILSLILWESRVVWGVRASNLYLEHYDWLTRLAYRLEIWLSRFTDLIIVNSQAGFNHALSNGFPEGRMVVIHNGIDTDSFQPDLDARARLRAEWGVIEQDRLIGIVARLDPMKDHKTFLHAAALVLKETTRVKFVCVGSGDDELRRELSEMANSLGLSERLVWSSARSDMSAVYNAMDMLVSSSCGEGFSNVIGEAMACGLMCVATNVGDSALIVGDQDHIVPPSDPLALKTAIVRCLGKLSEGSREHQARRQRIVERFSTANLEARTEAALLQLCRNH